MVHNLKLGANPLVGQRFSTYFFSSQRMIGRESLGTAAKLSLQLGELYGNVLRVYTSSIAIVFFLISPLIRCENQEVQRVKVFTWACVAAVLGATLFVNTHDNAMVAFIPMAIVLGTKTFMDFIPRHTVETVQIRMKLITVFVILNILPFCVGMAPSWPPPWMQRIYLKNMADMHSMMHSGDMLMTNAQEWLAYYGEFNTLPLPASKKELATWQDTFGALRFAAVCPYGEKGSFLSKLILEMQQ